MPSYTQLEMPILKQKNVLQNFLFPGVKIYEITTNCANVMTQNTN